MFVCFIVFFLVFSIKTSESRLCYIPGLNLYLGKNIHCYSIYLYNNKNTYVTHLTLKQMWNQNVFFSPKFVLILFVWFLFFFLLLFLIWWIHKTKTKHKKSNQNKSKKKQKSKRNKKQNCEKNAFKKKYWLN